jgi:hypothetical protein
MAFVELVNIERVSDHLAKRLGQHRRNSIAIPISGSHHRAELIERAATLEGASRAVDHQAAQKSREISEISACQSLRNDGGST